MENLRREAPISHKGFEERHSDKLVEMDDMMVC
jgi:hypothetical protein